MDYLGLALILGLIGLLALLFAVAVQLGRDFPENDTRRETDFDRAARRASGWWK